MFELIRQSRLYVDSDDIPRVILKIYQNENKFKYTICDFENREKILFGSPVEFDSFREAREDAYRIIDEKFADPNYNWLEGFGTNSPD